MQKHTITILATLIAILASASIVYANPWDHIFPYTDFNTTTVTWVALPKSYTEWKVQITNGLEFNATNAESAQIYLSPVNTLTGTPPPAPQGKTFLRVTSWADRTLEVWYSNGANEQRIVLNSSGWIAASNTILLTYYNGKLNVGYTTDPDALLSNYNASGLTISYVGVFGEEDIQVCDSGFLTVAVESAEMQKLTDVALSWVPVIVIFAMLSVVLAMIKKLS